MLLSASGRGYHVFVFAREPRPVAEWVRLLKDTCELVGAPIQDGVCEIFPNERTEKQEVGRAIRVPGSFNPSTSEVELILADTIRALLDHLALKQKLSKPPLLKVRPFYHGNLSENKEADNSSYSTGGFCSASTHKLIERVIAKYPIRAKSTRNGVLLKLAGELFHKFGHELSERIVRDHYEFHKKHVTTSLREHVREFLVAWDSFLRKAIKSLSASERRIFEQLQTKPQREGVLVDPIFCQSGEGQRFRNIAIEPRRSTEYYAARCSLCDFQAR